MGVYDNFYINGAWVDTGKNGTYPVINAFSEKEMGSVPMGNADTVDAAVAAAKAALPAWSALSVDERADYLQKISDGLKARSEELAKTISGEVGMPLKLSGMIQAGNPIRHFKNYARMIREYALEEEVGNSVVYKEPIGVVGCITPWNYPLHQVAAKVAPALAAGNTVVLKPSEEAPLNAFILAEVIDEVGLPAGVFNLICGTGPSVGAAMSAHPDIDMISFTGSTNAGKMVTKAAADTVKRVTLELGGKSAAVVLDDADLELAVKRTVSACFLNSGQTCTAFTRLLVPASRYDEAAAIAKKAAEKFQMGDPLEDTTRLGPLISDIQRKRVREYIQKGIDEGAELITGGLDVPENVSNGFFVAPTVFGKVSSDMTIAQEEIFGPVLAILPYEDEADALRLANDSIYGLAGSVWSGDQARAHGFARKMLAGQIDINGANFNFAAPFGGFKQSGNGRELGVYGLEEFFELKAVQLPAA